MQIRIEDRLVADMPTIARIPAAQIDARILDISTTGCRIRTGSRFAKIGATILLTLLDGEECSGQIAWRVGEECGVKFHQEITLQSLDRMANA